MNRDFSEKELEVLSTMFPMWKVVIEDTYRYRDVDSGIWVNSEPHELLRTGNKSVLYVKDNVNEDWKELYRIPSDLARAHVKVEEIKSHYNYWKNVFLNKDLVMFEYENQVFKDPYVMFNQLCISGTPIEPEKYYCEEGYVKVDFSESYVFGYERDELLMKNGQLYMNGELLYSREDLEKEEIKYYQLESMFGKEARDWVHENIPEAKRFSSWGASGKIRN
jgi:hypothetical protein